MFMPGFLKSFTSLRLVVFMVSLAILIGKRVMLGFILSDSGPEIRLIFFTGAYIDRHHGNILQNFIGIHRPE